MRLAFDWKPLLSDAEVVVWEGQSSRLRNFAFGAVVTAIATAGWLLAMGEMAQAPGGADCLAVDCPTADRTAGFVAYFAGPVSMLLGVFLLLLSASRQVSAVTSERVLDVTLKQWRRHPAVKQLPVKGARAMLNSAPLITLGLLVSSPHASQRILAWVKSRTELKRAQALIEKLSSEGSPVQGPTP